MEDKPKIEVKEKFVEDFTAAIAEHRHWERKIY